MARKIITVDTFKRKPILFEDRRYLVKSSDYLPYELKLAEMLALGEVDKSFFSEKASALLSASNQADNISILDMKGVDGYDIDSHFNRIRKFVMDTHKVAFKKFNEDNQKALEEHYKQKYSNNDKNNPEQ